MVDEIKKEDADLVIYPETSEKPADGIIAGRSRMRRIGSRCWSFVLLCGFIIAGLQLGGLVRYAHMVTTPTAPIVDKADGIVVLTGGENRIHAAMKLLSEGTAERLLLTGVNSVLTQDSLKNIFNIDEALFECCIEIDWTARDTIGNALATKKWAEQFNVKDLVVVTGAFHMPRALKELDHAMQGVKFIAAPVNVPSGDKWWRDYSRIRDMLREYAKLIFVSGRDYVNAWTGKPWPTMPLRRFDESVHLSTEKKNEKVSPLRGNVTH
ncbi:MAG: YdcF family protein [Hyphomicrobiales bacterium]